MVRGSLCVHKSMLVSVMRRQSMDKSEVQVSVIGRQSMDKSEAQELEEFVCSYSISGI